MISEENLIEICTISLTCSNQDFIGNISTILTDPLNYPQLLKVIDNPYVAFSFCLAIKNKLKKDKDSQSSFSSTNSSSSTTQDLKIQQLVQIANETSLMLRLKADAKTKKSCSNQNGLIMKTLNKKEGQFFSRGDPKTQLQRWNESIIYMNLLLSSFQLANSNNLSSEDLQWFAAMDKLRDQLIGVFIVMIAFEYRGHLDGLSNIFQNLIKYINQCLQPEENSRVFKINNIYTEIINYITRCENTFLTRLFCLIYCRRIFNEVAVFLSKFNEYAASQPKLLAQSIAIIKELYTFFNRPYEKTIIGVEITQIYDGDNMFEPSKAATIIPEWLLKFTYQFILLLKQIIGNTSVTTFNIIIGPCLQIIEIISPYATQFKLEESQIHQKQRQQDFAQFQQHLFQCMNDIILKWLQMHQQIDYSRKNNCEENQFYLEISIIETLTQVFSHHIIFARKDKHLLFIVIKEFCRKIIEMVPLQISLGFQSPITKIFDFLINVYLLINQIDEEELMSFYMIQIFDHFLNKCCTSVYNEIFPNFRQQNQACQDFYCPMITFSQKLYAKSNGKRDGLSVSFIAIIKVKLQVIFENSCEKGIYLVRLAIETIKNIEENKNRQFAEEKCQLVMYLLQKLPGYSETEYLLLLDAIIEQLVQQDASNLDESASFLWYYIYRNTTYMFSQFVYFLSSQVLNFLYSTQSNYVAHYAIHLIAKLCSNIRQIEIKNDIIGNKTNNLSLFDKPETPLYNFIANLEETVLNDLNNYEQRVKLFQIIGILTMKTTKDAYHIYDNLIRKNLIKQTEQGTLHYLMDVEGLLSITIQLKYKILILELILQDLKQNKSILSIFTKEKLQNHENYFNIFTNFVIQLLTNIKNENKCLSRPFLTSKIQLIFNNQLDILSELYDQQNFETINQVYNAFASLKNGSIFPKLPEQLLRSIGTINVVDYLFKNLYVVGQVSQLIILYKNIFERQSISMTESSSNSDFLYDEIIDVLKMPDYLALLAEEIEFRQVNVFFNYKKVIQRIVFNLYKASTENHSFSLTVDSLEIDYDSDYDEKQFTSASELFSQFFKNKQYKKLLKILAKVQYYLEYIENQVEKEYEPYQELFFNQAKSNLSQIM